MVVGGDVVVVVVVDVVVDVTFHSMETRRSSADPSREESCPDHPSPPRASRINPPLGFRWGQTTYPSPAPHNSGGDSGLRVLARTRLDPGCRACLSRGVVVKSSLPEFHHLLIQLVLPTYLGSSL